MIDKPTMDSLKELLVNSTDFQVFAEAVLDAFDDGRALLDVGIDIENEIIHASVNQALSMLYLKPMKLDIRMMRLPEFQFVHGISVTPGKVVNFWFFEDIDLGMIYAYPGPEGGSSLMRFSAVIIPNPGPSRKK